MDWPDFWAQFWKTLLFSGAEEGHENRSRHSCRIDTLTEEGGFYLMWYHKALKVARWEINQAAGDAFIWNLSCMQQGEMHLCEVRACSVVLCSLQSSRSLWYHPVNLLLLWTKCFQERWGWCCEGHTMLQLLSLTWPVPTQGHSPWVLAP